MNLIERGGRCWEGLYPVVDWLVVAVAAVFIASGCIVHVVTNRSWQSRLSYSSSPIIWIQLFKNYFSLTSCQQKRRIRLNSWGQESYILTTDQNCMMFWRHEFITIPRNNSETGSYHTQPRKCWREKIMTPVKKWILEGRKFWPLEIRNNRDRKLWLCREVNHWRQSDSWRQDLLLAVPKQEICVKRGKCDPWRREYVVESQDIAGSSKTSSIIVSGEIFQDKSI